MKKTKLLSALTAVAVVATTMGTFAAWDETSDSVTKTLTLSSPVEQTVTLSDFTRNTLSDKSFVYESDGTVQVSNIPTTLAEKYHVAFTAEVYKVDGQNESLVEDGTISASVTPAKAPTNGTVVGTHNYKVNVEQKSDTISGEYKIKVTSTLTENPTT